MCAKFEIVGQVFWKQFADIIWQFIYASAGFGICVF